jgi:hypothetical protein
MQTQTKNNAHNRQKTRSERDSVPPHIFTYTDKKKTPHRAKKRPARHKEKPPEKIPNGCISFFYTS